MSLGGGTWGKTGNFWVYQTATKARGRKGTGEIWESLGNTWEKYWGFTGLDWELDYVRAGEQREEGATGGWRRYYDSVRREEAWGVNMACERGRRRGIRQSRSGNWEIMGDLGENTGK